jgi:hypothetical protein
MTDQATMNTMKVMPLAGELHGVFLCMNDDNDKSNHDNTIKP